MFLYFEDNAGATTNNKGEMRGSAIIGPVTKECADVWPRIIQCSQHCMIPRCISKKIRIICSPQKRKDICIPMLLHYYLQ